MAPKIQLQFSLRQVEEWKSSILVLLVLLLLLFEQGPFNGLTNQRGMNRFRMAGQST